MKKEEFEFLSADDRRTKIHAVKWCPDSGSYAGVVQIVHGMREYIERYEDFASWLCDRGFIVVGHDHIGHGRSVEDELERGIMHTDKPAEVMVEDIYTLSTMIHETCPQLPHVILGHSMGSYLLRMYLILKAEMTPYLSAAIIMGTGWEKPIAMAGAKRFLGVFAKSRGWDHRSVFVERLMYGSYYKDYDTTNTDPERSWLTKDVENASKALSDPKIRYLFSLNGYRLLITACLFTSKMKNLKKMRMDLPILFISGSDDPVGQLGQGVRQATMAFHKSGVSDLSLKLFKGDRHEILNETDREDVYSYIYYWMKKRIKDEG